MDRLVPVPPIDDGIHLRDGGGDRTYCGDAADAHSLGCRKEWERHAKTRCIRCELALVKRDRKEVAGLLRLSLEDCLGDLYGQAEAAVKRWG